MPYSPFGNKLSAPVEIYFYHVDARFLFGLIFINILLGTFKDALSFPHIHSIARTSEACGAPCVRACLNLYKKDMRFILAYDIGFKMSRAVVAVKHLKAKLFKIIYGNILSRFPDTFLLVQLF